MMRAVDGPRRSGAWTAAAVLAVAMWMAACHPPRSPRDVAEGRISGEWTAHSAAVGEPRDTGEVSWRLRLHERESGKVEGSGGVWMRRDSAAFELSGIRGENELTLQFALGGERVKYVGSVMDPKTIVGEVQTAGDTLPVTFTRK